ncbi:16S rRNA (guanine(527)-N(7))-methyltransferase RsmG [Candidatus Methylomirabilis sp.]|uniref:16S rRNA (guanine(527)-N(7))-methyltransferase RsmG n=1 Tax=Candidatus Methylomirabilis sp. TaxID=2032687 RepID=UPI002A604FE5|nr:16S rRNA (guanine(527)-N(7))-methyltransferase RsmG [Candidatus Methylomirabilis sp.]
MPEQAAQQSVACRSELLRRGLDHIGLRLTPVQHEALSVYLSELRRWAAHVNLTGLRSEEAIIREGFLRSFAYRAAFEPTPLMKAVDVGSGAGFPGLVLKIGYPDIDMLLLEPRRRRATFLRSIIRRLELTGIRCIQARVEELHGSAEHQGGYDVAFARAVGPVPDVARRVEPLLKPGGRLILQMGQRTRGLLPLARPLLRVLGMRTQLLEVPAPDVGYSPTHLLILDKLPLLAS